MIEVLEPRPWSRSFDVVEACRRDPGIDRLLVELLGGVPTGRAPRRERLDAAVLREELEGARQLRGEVAESWLYDVERFVGEDASWRV